MKTPPPLLSSLPTTAPNAEQEASSSTTITPSMYMANFENIIAPGNEPVMTKEYKAQVANQFDKYLNPQSLKLHVLRSEKVRKIIDFYARTQKVSTKQIERQVKEIIDEIGLERNLAIIRWCGMAITAIGKRICSGIYVNKESIRTVKEGLGNAPVLYLPSHRSYMDFILMSYICFYYDIEIPGIAAGMDFHSMFGMGTMLRKTGAFFMRRSFSNDELYWDIFREYMYALVAVYHIGVEFFIEGTRSRNFKALVPKVGLLSMALQPYFTGEVSDITVVPVSISYERVLEEQLFVYELLGVPKPKESTKGFFKALKIIEERFGRMYMDFGEPISVREFFGHTAVDRMPRATLGAHLQKLDKTEIELVKKLANEVIYQQQRRIVISTFNLVSLYYASQLYSKKQVNLDEVANGICELKEMFEHLGANVATKLSAIKTDILETVEIHSNILHFTHQSHLHLTHVAAALLAQQIDPKRLKAHALSPLTMAVAVPSLGLQLYINPCLFWLARPAYLIIAAMDLQQQRKISGTVDGNYQSLLQELSRRANILDNIFKHEFIIASNREDEEFKRNLEFLEAHQVLSISKYPANVVVHENECSRVILSALAPFLCVYYQLTVTVNQLPLNVEFSNKDILIRIQERIENLLKDDQACHVHPYCLALDNLNIALQSLVQEGYLLKNKETGLLQHSSTNALDSLELQLLNYCQLLPFEQYHESTSQLRQNQLISSKL